MPAGEGERATGRNPWLLVSAPEGLCCFRGVREGLCCVRGVPEGLCCVFGGFSRPGHGGDGPGATRWQAAPLGSRSAPAASRPRRGAPRLPGIPAAPGTGFPCRHPLQNRGAPEPEPKALSQCGAAAGTVLKGSDAFPRQNAAFPFPPACAFGFLLFFFPFLFSPIPLQRAACFSLPHFMRQGCKIRQMHPANAG